MRRFVLFAVLLMPAASWAAETSYFGHDKVDEALAKGSPLGNLLTALDIHLRVMANRKSGSGGGEIHEKETDVVYIMDGTATMETGGTVIDPHTTAPGQVRGSSVKGGQTWHLSKGDLLVIPAGTPHQIKESESFDHFTVKIISDRAPPPAAAVYVNHEQVTRALSENMRAAGVRIPHLVDEPVQVSAGYRSDAGEVEIHESGTDVMYVIGGAATMVTGGTIIGARTSRPGEIKGNDVQGGQTRIVTKGDVMVIPAGTAHWHKVVPESITYLTVKVPK